MRMENTIYLDVILMKHKAIAKIYISSAWTLNASEWNEKSFLENFLYFHIETIINMKVTIMPKMEG